MPLQGVPHQRFEVGDARHKTPSLWSLHHPHRPSRSTPELIQRLPSVGSYIVEGGAHFGIGGGAFLLASLQTLPAVEQRRRTRSSGGVTGVITPLASSPCSSSSVETRNLNEIARITHRRHRSFLGLCTRQACSKVPAVRECPHIHGSTSPPFPLCVIQ